MPLLRERQQQLLWLVAWGTAKTALAMLVALLACLAVAHGVSIAQFGAIPNNGTVAASIANSAALVKAMVFANASAVDRVVVVPAGQEFTFFYLLVGGLNNITIRFDGPAVSARSVFPLALLLRRSPSRSSSTTTSARGPSRTTTAAALVRSSWSTAPTLSSRATGASTGADTTGGGMSS